MDIITRDGFKFGFSPKACQSCIGYCCVGSAGYIWVSDREIEEITDFLGMAMDDFTQDYLRRVGNRFCLKELAISSSHHCVFFDDQSKGCSIYEARPSQCRDFPFWNRFKVHVEEAVKECPGVVILQA
jgi:Fe-S-cluster containining protein